MTAFVLDCSIAVTWCFEDEATPATDALLDRLGGEAAAAPAIWPLELGNVLVMAERRGRISSAKAAEFLALVEDLSILIDDETPQRALREVLALARAAGLTTYDAAYLELAMRLGVPLATKDAHLRDAAVKLGSPLLPV
ncbi:MAG: type II toxin-antitoxin system VapC family toxin [Kiloniellaceae bacterium]